MTLDSFVTDAQTRTHAYTVASAAFSASQPLTQTYAPASLVSYRCNSVQSYSLEPAVYITPLAQTRVEYRPAERMGPLLGFTYPGYRVLMVNDGLSDADRTETFAHENMHQLIHLVGADKGLSHAQVENLTRRATMAQLGPSAHLHRQLGLVRE